MKAIPLVRANAILPMIKFLQQVGTPIEKFMKQANLPMNPREQPEALIPLYHGFSFFELVARNE